MTQIPMKTVTFTPQQAKDFIKVYNLNRAASNNTFIFEGNEYLTDYAYYLIQYLVMQKAVAGDFDENKIFTIKKSWKI